ncbi:UNVERIFIED_CONTAM: hypothetical protein PYX00_007468 [Menopon gallinae]|uniref:NADH:ubiquinone oxidoreductase intermediate-associated protein 30 domain-containing protein n=1 Tax=Menopon gallinae TaxID=328185 RepID=A0AAW2HJD3_9NEOP
MLTRIFSVCPPLQQIRNKSKNTHPAATDIPTFGPGTKSTTTFDEVWDEMIKDPTIILKGAKLLGKEFKLLAEESKSMLRTKVMKLSKGDIVMLFTFEEDDSINKFVVTTDKDNNIGYSTASFVKTQYETGMFSGYISTELPKDGITKYAGFASLSSKPRRKSFFRYATYDWASYTHLVMKIRGDGRTYHLILSCPRRLDATWGDQYVYPLFTRGGPYWQIVKIPLSNFYFGKAGSIHDSQTVILPDICQRIAITLADNTEGPFKLEIEYIGMEFQPLHVEETPYEEYSIDEEEEDD